MRLPVLAALGVAAYLAFLLATLPASIAARALAASAHGLAIHDASGTIWNGAARATVATPGGRVAFDRVAWRLLPARLLSGRIAFDVTATAPGLEERLEAARSPTRWEARALQARGEAAAAIAALPWIAAWRPEGRIVATAPELSSDGADLRGSARIEWHGAAVGLSEVRPLGSYRADVTAEGAGARIAVTTLDGALRLAGQGTLVLPARLEFSGEARAAGPQAEALAPLLDLLGPRRADGARALTWRTR